MAPYQGPFKVLEQHAKYFTLELGNREDTVSTDMLKPAFMVEPLRYTPKVRGGARSVQTPEAVRPPIMVSDTETETNPVVTASGRLVTYPCAIDNNDILLSN